MNQQFRTKKNRLHMWSVFLISVFFSLNAQAQIVLHEATDVTQTKATLSADFPDLSATHGFQYKYGTLPELDDFSRLVLTEQSDPILLTTTGNAWIARTAKGWVESKSNMSAGQSSIMAATVNLTEQTAITFEWGVDSEEGVGILSFIVDGSIIESISGEVGFASISYTASAGMHTLQWQYKKNATSNVGFDIGMVRNVCFQNTTSGEWETIEIDSDKLYTITLPALYPNKDYIYRAYYTVNGVKEYSAIKHFHTLSVNISNSCIEKLTQTKATVNCKATFGDAIPFIQCGIIVNSKVQPVLNTIDACLLTADSDPVDIRYYGLTGYYPKDGLYISYGSGAYIEAEFTLYQESKISFKYSASNSCEFSLYVDGIEKEVLRNNSKTVSLQLDKGKHIIEWKYSSWASEGTVQLYDLKITNVNVSLLQNYDLSYDPTLTTDTIPLISSDYLNYTINGLYPTCKSNALFFSKISIGSQEETMFSNLVEFKTLNVCADTLKVQNIKQTSALICGKVYGGDATIIATGLQYKDATSTHWTDYPQTCNDTVLFQSISRLRPSIRYNYRSYIQAQNCDTLFSEVGEFTTAAIKAIQPSAISITQTTASVKGSVEYGDANIFNCGLQLKSVYGNNDWETKVFDGEGETFTFDFTNLSLNTSYMARTYVECISGTIYSDTLIFNTKGIELSIDTITDVCQRSAVVHGKILFGDAPIENAYITVHGYDSVYSVISTHKYMLTSSEEGQITMNVDKLEPNNIYSANIKAISNTKEYGSKDSVFIYNIVETSNLQILKALCHPKSGDNIHVTTSGTSIIIGEHEIYNKWNSGVGGYVYASIYIKERTKISFEWYCTGKETRGGSTSYNLCTFDVDGTEKARISSSNSSSNSYKEYSCYLEPGYHNLKWYLGSALSGSSGVRNLYIAPTVFIPIVNILSPQLFKTTKFISGTCFATLTQTTATLQAKIQPTNEEGVEYYLTNDNGTKVSATIQDSILSADITGLIPNTDYKYYTVAKTADGQEYQDSICFKTLPVTVSLSTSNVTQTSATVRVTTNAGTATVENMQYRIDYGSWQAVNGNSISLTSLSPNRSYRVNLQWKVCGTAYSNYIDVKTASVSVYAGTVISLQTNALVEMGSMNVGTATKIASGIMFNDITYPLDKGEAVRLTELLPATKYSYTYFVDTEEGGRVSGTKEFTTQTITSNTSSVSSISNRSATMNGTIDCDGYSSAEFGFQWKQMEGWNSDPAFTKGVKNEDGTISVALVNGMLEPNTDYQYRTAVRYQGQIYYANNWETFRTESEFVYYPASVYTIFRTDRENNCLILCGYYVAGSEAVTKQGYEYWSNQPNARGDGLASTSANDIVTITTNESMQYSLDLNTLADGNYSVRAFVTTTSGKTTYGATLTFVVQNQQSSITDVRGNVKFSKLGTTLIIHHGMSLSCSIYTLNGICVLRRRLVEETEMFELQRHIAYIIRLSNGISYKIKM